MAGYGHHRVLPELCSKPDYEFAPDGHYFTTNKFAELAGVSAEVNREITLFSQAPDDLALSYSATAVAIWGVVWIPYRQRIVETLHSLHGGHQEASRQGARDWPQWSRILTCAPRTRASSGKSSF
ncbi:hypothetical protein J2W39_005916 [Variovorax paradoxus]|uniref:Uncharacterized protein n=1 Tax=Variovorax paradoxus TaxID=34073 RepID=A0AAW8ES45_VARPD|nr:hypothetical protein [Variovorax paradoxus]MDP9974646.1 hypothetical protein [Variovorax paradoxus]